MQQTINKMNSDNERKNSKKILVDMFEKAMDSNLLTKNSAKQINTIISKEKKKERRVLTICETELFLNMTSEKFYYYLFVLALETGMRIGELCALQWSDIDFKNKKLNVCHTLCYFSNNGKYIFEMHETKTLNGYRTIPLTQKAIITLKKQKIKKQEILFKGKVAEEQYRDLVFVTRNNRPTQQFLVQECMNLSFAQIRKENPDFEYFTPHTFRHSFATRALENGMHMMQMV